MQTVSTWRTAEFSFQSTKDVQNPYADIDAGAIFTGPGGVRIRRPAFWDGGHTWKVCFAPTQAGQWHYALSSNDGSDTGLNDLTGKFRSVDESGNYPVYCHGFLRKGPGGRYLAHADDTPFFWPGDTH
jgi:hypothetical protein